MNSSSPPLRSRYARPTSPLAVDMDNAQKGVDLLRPSAPFGRGAPVPLRVTKRLSEKEGAERAVLK